MIVRRIYEDFQNRGLSGSDFEFTEDNDNENKSNTGLPGM